MAGELKYDYDRIADVMYIREKGVSGKTFIREHHNESMVNLIILKETGKPVGMIITSWSIFARKYVFRMIWEKAAGRFSGFVKIPEKRLEACYAEFATAIG